MSQIPPNHLSHQVSSQQTQNSSNSTAKSVTSPNVTQTKDQQGSMRQTNACQHFNKVNILPEHFMDPAPPKSVCGYDLNIKKAGAEVVHNLETEITCRSEGGIQDSAEQALLLKQKGREVSVTFALNDEPYSVLAENLEKMGKAGIPVRIVAGEKATRASDRENGTEILRKALELIHFKATTGDGQNLGMKKVKLKVCYHDGSDLQCLVDKIQAVEQFRCHVNEVALQLQPLEELYNNFDAVAKYLEATGKSDLPMVCYAIIFANQTAYDKAPQKIKNLAGHAFEDQELYLRDLKKIVDQYEQASIRLSFFGFSKLHWRRRAAAINQCYQALH